MVSNSKQDGGPETPTTKRMEERTQRADLFPGDLLYIYFHKMYRSDQLILNTSLVLGLPVAHMQYLLRRTALLLVPIFIE
jgi:hypothetical protein